MDSIKYELVEALQPGRFINGKNVIYSKSSHSKFLYFLIVVWNKIIIYISFEKIDTHETAFIDRVLDFKRKIINLNPET